MWDANNGMSATTQSFRNQKIVQIGATTAKTRIAGLIQERLPRCFMTRTRGFTLTALFIEDREEKRRAQI